MPTRGWKVLLAVLALCGTGAWAQVHVEAGGGLCVENITTLDLIDPDVYVPKHEPLKPVTITAARNGKFAGQVLISCGAPIDNLKATVTDLDGGAAGKIPAANVQLRWGVADGVPRKNGQAGPFDSLEPEIPDEIKCFKKGFAILPMWINILVPKDAKPGEYKGKVTLKADEVDAQNVELVVKVFDYSLVDPGEYTGRMDIVESPESLAIAYDVEMWGDEHWKLLDQLFALLAESGDKTLYISAIRRTHFGNEDAMLRWVEDDNGLLQPNFDLVDKYLALAKKHMPKLPGVIFICWEAMDTMGHASGTGSAQRTHDRPLAITVLDPKTGELTKETGPAWGTPECKAFWKRFTDGLMPVLKKHGYEDSLLFGLLGDSRATQTAMDDICNAVPKEKAKWAVHSHHYADKWQGYEIGMGIALWGIHLNIVDPDKGYGYGWQNKMWLAYYPREFSMTSNIPEHRFKLEMWMGAFSEFEMQHKGTTRTACGLGRIGGNFWKVVRDRRGNPVGTLAGRYPESYWGQLNLNYCISSIYGRGKAGPVPTIRSEAFREGVRDMELRVYIEKALVLPENKGKLDAELAKKCRTMLDERIRTAIQWGGAGKDQTQGPAKKGRGLTELPQMNESLYGLAAEVFKVMGK